MLLTYPMRMDWAGEMGLTHKALYRTLARMSQQGKLAINGTAL